MATYDDKIVYGKDLVPYGQKIVDKMRGEVVDNLNSTDTNHPLSANQGKILNEGKLSKNGDTMNGQLKIAIDSKRGADSVLLYRDGVWVGTFGAGADDFFIANAQSHKTIQLKNNGECFYPADNLPTEAKEVVGAITELKNNKLEKGNYGGTAQDLKRDIDSKEPSIVKKSGFNLEKSDGIAYDSGDTLATSRAVKRAYDKGIEALDVANTKLNKTDKAESSKVADKLSSPKTISLSGDVSGSATFDGSSNSTINTTLNGIDASKITSGTINIDRLPHGALERLTVVENDNARFNLTKEQVQNGDTVKVMDTQKMYFVKDDTQLSNDNGYEEYTVGKATAVEWSGVQGKPSEFPPSAHNQASSTINSMNGYSKQEYGAISPSDSLNQAIGKLEGGLNSKLDKSGGEIYGQLKLKYNGMKRILLNDGGDTPYALFGSDGGSGDLLIRNERTGKQIILKGNEETYIDAPNLQTTSKNIVDGINEVNNKKFEMKGQITVDQANSLSLSNGLYDARGTIAGGIGGSGFYNLLNYGEYSSNNSKTQMAFPYYHNDDKSEMFFRTAAASGWRVGGWCRVWHSNNFDPNTKLSTNGGTISGNVTVQSNIVCNKKISAQSIIINGWELTIEE